ncbi:MAG: DUF1788 domain-containing protein [Candidatus Cloacimonetes bacterium]|nr:DUF1788 domain-containing protein [Candidatus Cloacimonadota bacterium]
MSRIDVLIQNYQALIQLPWDTAAPPQRVWFCVYEPKDENALRAKLPEFELSSQQHGKNWLQYDLENSFATWLSAHPYAERYFQMPFLLNSVLPSFKAHLIKEISSFIERHTAGTDTVFALSGLGLLFGFFKAKELIEAIAPLIKGRLLVFFPGTYENNNYRLLDGYDGWNYLAIPITSDKGL